MSLSRLVEEMDKTAEEQTAISEFIALGFEDEPSLVYSSEPLTEVI